ncbi:MAG: phospholipase D-like domain-containing protein [Chloroflexota bacterium]
MTKKSHLSRLSFLLLAALLLVMGTGLAPQNSNYASAQAATPAPTSTAVDTSKWLHVYFTDPSQVDESVIDANKTMARYVLLSLKAAAKTIDIASFDFNLPEVADALVAAKNRGVVVRAVLDEKNGNQKLKASDSPSGIALDVVKTLTDADITVVNGGRSNGLMHDKIIIVDSKLLFMGSWNMSYNDTYRNNNNLLVIANPTLIANYQAKFNELFVSKRFGTKAQVKALTPRFIIKGTVVENYFSPKDEVIAKLVNVVKSAQKSIKFMAFTYTQKDLTAAIIERAGAGIEVSGVIENRGASNGALPDLFCAGIPVRTDGNKYTMHHKVIIIDDQIVVTGSFNFTQTADNANDDNVLIIYNAAVADQYNQEFAKVYGIGKTPDASSIVCDAESQP